MDLSLEKIMKKGKWIRILVIILFLSAAYLLLLYHRELALLWKSLKSGEFHPIFLIVSFSILPLLGFPILPLLILVGAQFGSFIGLIIVFAVMPFHLLVSFWITHSMLRKPMERLLKARSISIPTIPERHRFKYSLIFMILPGLSYSLKNYLLPLSGLSFAPFLFCGWVSQGLLGVPFVVLGDAPPQWVFYIFLSVFIFYIILIFSRDWIKTLYDRIFFSRKSEKKNGGNDDGK